MVKGCSLFTMKRTANTVFGLSTGQLTQLAQKAVTNAVASNARADIPLTGYVDGRVQTIQASDPRLAALIARSRDETAAQALFSGAE